PGIVNLVNQISGITGQPELSAQDFQKLPAETKNKMIADSLGFFQGVPDKNSVGTQLQQFKNYQETYSHNPNPDPEITAKLAAKVALLQRAQDAYDSHDVNVAVSKANAEAPGKIATATAEARAKQAVENEQ